jgi:hypothetical protein
MAWRMVSGRRAVRSLVAAGGKAIRSAWCLWRLRGKSLRSAQGLVRFYDVANTRCGVGWVQALIRSIRIGIASGTTIHISIRSIRSSRTEPPRVPPCA